MQETTKKAALDILAARRPASILDAPCGAGWLGKRLPYGADVDGIDLYAAPEGAYRRVLKRDLDLGIPGDLPKYDCVASCEGIEHLTNPGLFLKTALERLSPGGFLLITTPNVWYPASRLKFLARGFFPGFPSLAGRIEPGTHMHVTPWSFPQLYLFMTLAGCKNVELHAEEGRGPRHAAERALALPQRLYCGRKAKKAGSDEERRYWLAAGSDASLYGRHLIVTGDR